MSERSYDLLTKIIRAVPNKYDGELEDVNGENFTKLSEGKVSEFQRKKKRGAFPVESSTIDEKDETHQVMTHGIAQVQLNHGNCSPRDPVSILVVCATDCAEVVGGQCWNE